MNMRERMARAIWAMEHPLTAWERAPKWMQDRYRDYADAALSALAEPTEAMLWAALSRPIAPQASTSDLHRLLFRAMIGAAGEG
jgi:hypothetical protein